MKINGVEYEAKHVGLRGRDGLAGSRSTVRIVTDLEYAAVVDLFSNPGEWSYIRKYDPETDGEGNVIYQEPDNVTDCTEYDRLLSIKDYRNGTLEVVMGKITAEEALAELVEALK